MTDSRPAVGQLVTPYLFLTGSWVHVQLLHNPRYRSVVMTQQTENLDVFPYEPVYDFAGSRSGLRSLSFNASKYLLGRFPSGPYVDAARRENVVLLHAHNGWEGARTVHLRRELDMPIITSFYGRDASMLPRKSYWRMLYEKLFREGDLFLAEGPHMGKTLKRIGCPEEKVRVVHLGVDLSRIDFKERKPGPDGEIIGLIAASFREKKGIVYALDAVARVVERWPRLKVRVIGDGPLRGAIEGKIKEHGLERTADLLGYLDFPSYLEELSKAHFLLSPSVTAEDGDCEGGAPVCLLDAQASGLPILATTHCDIPEVTVPDGSALLSAERDSGQLAENLASLLGQPEQWAEMGRVGRRHVETEFDIGKQAGRIADIYDEVLR